MQRVCCVVKVIVKRTTDGFLVTLVCLPQEEVTGDRIHINIINANVAMSVCLLALHAKTAEPMR